MISSAGKIALGMAIASLCGQAVAAQDALSAKLVAKQKWTMSAPLNKPTPDCVETWTFNADSRMTIKSGAELVTRKWRVGDDGGQVSLYMQTLSSTGGADCLGTETAAFNGPEAQEGGALWLLEFNTGDAVLLCNPKYVLVEKTEEQMPIMDDENCWGELKPAK